MPTPREAPGPVSSAPSPLGTCSSGCQRVRVEHLQPAEAASSVQPITPVNDEHLILRSDLVTLERNLQDIFEKQGQRQEMLLMRYLEKFDAASTVRMAEDPAPGQAKDTAYKKVNAERKLTPSLTLASCDSIFERESSPDTPNEPLSPFKLQGASVLPPSPRLATTPTSLIHDVSVQTLSAFDHIPGFSHVRNFIEWWSNLKEPKRSGQFARLVDGHAFSALCTAVIVLNVVFQCFATNNELHNLKSGNETEAYFEIDAAFLFFYTLEITLKLLVHRAYFFCNDDMKWNLFDLFLVLSGAVDLILAAALQGSGMISLTFLRSQRVLKVTRVLRIFTLMKSLKELRLMLNSLIGSMSALVWSFIMIGFIFYIFAILFSSSVATHIKENAHDLGTGLMDKFGSVQASMLTLLAAATGGEDWRIYYNLLSQTGALSAVVFIFFVGFTQIALWNIVTGIFIESAMVHAQPSRDEKSIDECKKALETSRELRQMCANMDTNNSGTIGFGEFNQFIADPRHRAKMELLGVNVHDAQVFFRLMSHLSDDGDINITDFVNGCCKLRGFATRVDLQTLSFELRKIYRSVRKVESHMTELELMKK